MIKALVSVAAVAGLLWGGWYYLPDSARERLLGFVGMVARRDTEEVQRAIGGILLPEDPTERRAVLAGELKKSIRELRRRDVSAVQGPDAAAAAGLLADEKTAAVSTADVLRAAEAAIKGLEDANEDASVGRTIVEKILERVLPAPAVQCPKE